MILSILQQNIKGGESIMAITIDSKIGDILADEKAKAILDKHLPQSIAQRGQR